MDFWNNKPQGQALKSDFSQNNSFNSNTSSNNFVDPDDFFKDMGRKPKTPKVETKVEIESPDIVGLREAPLPVPPSTLTELDTADIVTDGLIDKRALDDGLYHGFMDDI